MSNSGVNPPLAEPPDGPDAHGTGAQTLARGQQRRARGRRGDDGSREQSMVPRAEFRSYYGRPVLKPPVWEWKVPAYLFTGGLSAGSAVLAAGADLTSRPALRRAGRISSLLTLLVSAYFLIADLGRPERFHHMLRVAKPTSPMSVGTWILTLYAPGVGIAALSELLPAKARRTIPGRLLDRLARPAALASAALAPAVASYTAVLLSQTAAPAWHEAHPQLPFIFTGSAAASAGGLAMVLTPVDEAGPARMFACYGGVSELVASKLMEQQLGLASEAYTTGRAHQLRKWSQRLTTAGLIGATLAGRRSRAIAGASGLALLAGSALQRFGVFEAGVASTKDPKYVVVPQRQRLDRSS
jgi:Polysulphide reductase, NrfD